MKCKGSHAHPFYCQPTQFSDLPFSICSPLKLDFWDWIVQSHVIPYTSWWLHRITIKLRLKGKSHLILNLISMLRKLARVNDVNTVKYSLDPTQFFSFPRIWWEQELELTCACANKIPRQQYLWTWCQSVVPNDVPQDFGPWVAFVR